VMNKSTSPPSFRIAIQAIALQCPSNTACPPTAAAVPPPTMALRLSIGPSAASALRCASGQAPRTAAVRAFSVASMNRAAWSPLKNQKDGGDGTGFANMRVRFRISYSGFNGDEHGRRRQGQAASTNKHYRTNLATPNPQRRSPS
jgi:hypothetical protein